MVWKIDLYMVSVGRFPGITIFNTLGQRYFTIIIQTDNRFVWVVKMVLEFWQFFQGGDLKSLIRLEGKFDYDTTWRVVSSDF